ncbi:hypothetical protein Pst134EB_001458 [Puccinia striiformis f. sp. tritici]|nr:hypothetical protein Pst134EB_001458 [Puccinia striiformis f. sp. tritici]
MGGVTSSKLDSYMPLIFEQSLHLVRNLQLKTVCVETRDLILTPQISLSPIYSTFAKNLLSRKRKILLLLPTNHLLLLILRINLDKCEIKLLRIRLNLLLLGLENKAASPLQTAGPGRMAFTRKTIGQLINTVYNNSNNYSILLRPSPLPHFPSQHKCTVRDPSC